MFKKIKLNQLKNFILCIIICQIPGLIGSIFTIQAIPIWYNYLHKPSFNPPNWLFGPAWTLLYFLIGVALFTIWQFTKASKKKTLALKVLTLQLSLNAIWSIIFFGLRNPLLAFIEIVILIIILLWNIKLFYDLKKPAGLLLIPYLLWTLFASLLNLSIYLLN